MKPQFTTTWHHKSATSCVAVSVESSVISSPLASRAGVAAEDAGTKLFTLLGIDEYDPMAHARPNKPNA